MPGIKGSSAQLIARHGTRMLGISLTADVDSMNSSQVEKCADDATNVLQKFVNVWGRTRRLPTMLCSAVARAAAISVVCSTTGERGAGVGSEQNGCGSRSKNGVDAMEVAGVDGASELPVKMEDERVESVGVDGIESVREKTDGGVDVLRTDGDSEAVEEAGKARGLVCFHCSRSNAA